ncbi:DNA polymerase zeta catalytic subunit [Grifola frondosa]|uniref:DNA polymerase n=1 Tax=Grifola frondosa TaxID=5627 RepID=A0A1C7MST9_GRIFR|nr:DNA polymerase zeta catalytic subunit [Grifola frondosa]
MPVVQQQDRVLLTHPKGSSAEILFYGATVISWKSGNPTDSTPLERLFVSSKAAFDGSKPVRGGIPVVFPCFGPPTHSEHLKLPQHGFARSETWTLDHIIMDNEAGVSIKLTLEPTASIKEKFERPFLLEYVVTLAEHQLATDLHVKNTALSTSSPFEFQALFHNYIRAPASAVLVTPLQGVSYYDKTESTEELRNSVYENAPGRYQVTSPQGVIEVRTKNFNDVVVWNPQREAGSKIGDMEDGGWERYLFDVIDDSNMSIQEWSLRVKINQIDYTLAPPGPLDNSSLHRVPIIRIYGESSTRLNACLHIHQVYPYFFVEYSGKMNPDHVGRYIARLTHSLNHAIAVSMKRNPHSSKSQFVRAIILVKGVHFYGFHASYSPFLKILIADPTFVHRAVTIVQSGTVMKTRFRVYESHLSYILQFMCDFGLYGCGWIELGDVWQRGNEAVRDEDQDNWTSTHVVQNTNLAFKQSPYFRQSRMPLEADVAAHQVLNRHRLAARNIHHKLTIPAPPLPPEPLVLSVRELWEDERRRRAAKGLSPSPEIPKDPSANSRGHGGAWVAEARWWEEIRTRIENEQAEEKMPTPVMQWEKWVMTTFESVEALWEEEHKTWKPGRGDANPKDWESESAKFDEGEDNPYEATVHARQGGDDQADFDVDVDETMLSSQAMTQLMEREEADWENVVGGHGERDDDGDGVREQFDDPAEDGPPADLQLENEARSSDDPKISTSLFFSEIQPFEDADEGAYFNIRGPKHHTKRKTQGHKSFPRHGVLSPTRSAYTLRTPPATPTKPRVRVRIVPNGSISQMTVDEVEQDTTCGIAVSSQSQHEQNRTDDFTTPTRDRRNIELATSVTHLPLQVHQIYRDPYYSKEDDAPERPREYAGLVFNLKGGDGVSTLEDWHSSSTILDAKVVARAQLDRTGVGGWEYAIVPQAYDKLKQPSQIEGPTQLNPYGLEATLAVQSDAVQREGSKMSVLALEVFAPSRINRVPNANDDEVVAVFYSFQNSEFDRSYGSDETFRCSTGIIAVEDNNFGRLRDIKMDTVSSELELLNRLIDIVVDLDPDIVVGWEVQAASWGYLDARAHTYGLDMGEQISRAPGRTVGGYSDQWGMRTTSTFKVTGRHVLNLWRIIRAEQNFNIYTFENVVFQILHRRTPRYTTLTLTEWLHSTVPEHAARVMRYFACRTSMVLEILDVAEVVTKNAEFARVFGVDFFSVLSRGSQFKVESFMFRIAKPESFVLLSPSKQDVGKQNAAECMPLIMEPLSAFYNSPLLVLDFQSLYPSIMIAYNYCYSTCLGRVTDFKAQNKFGVTELRQPVGMLETLQEHINVAPNGIIYVKPEVRRGLLGRMLTELLDTRVMVKQAMKGAKDDKALRRVLDARQLGLKYIANVTYGYTSATYSGRMPAVEIADSIVQSGRETLEKAIRVIDSTKKWGAKVVYGDTDSLFVYLRGKTKEQAFRIGNEMADTITAMNPAPVKLKFEKVYLPCVLMAKKRYVGFKFENPDDKEPVFDAKGIETVRRDGVPAQQKMTETCLKILFRTQDLSKVKDYCYQSWSRILENKVSIQDFIFAKEVKMGTYSDKGPPPPGVTVAARRIMEDPNDEPQYGERIPYVVVRGEPGSRLTDRAVSPEELFDSHKRLDAAYYISRVLIPPLERVFNLVGADVRSWYDDMPKTQRADQPTDAVLLSPRKAKSAATSAAAAWKIDDHFTSSHCMVCSALTPGGLCEVCRADPQTTISSLLARMKVTEDRLRDVQMVCGSCCGTAPAEPVKCESLDCPWLFERKKAESKADALVAVEALVEEVENEWCSDDNSTFDET